MKTGAAAIVIAFVVPSLFAQFDYDQNLHRVTPDRGPVGGGTTVTIEGEFNFSGIADPCAGPAVYVGGVRAEVRSYDETEIQFVTPPYTGGRFDVSVDRCGARGAMKNAFAYVADNNVRWERVLLPVYLSADVPGAHGSVWRTTLLGYNTGGFSIFTVHPESRCSANPCADLVQNGAFVPQFETDQHEPGRLVYIEPASTAKRFNLNLRVRDLSRESSTLGTELRPVFEDDAFGPYDSFVLVNVPLGEPYRQKLRIYRIDAGAPSTVNVFFQDPQIRFNNYGSRDIALAGEPATDGFLHYPGYAELDLDRLPELAGHTATDVLIDVTEGRYWAYVSVTNNVTQQVTHVTP